MPTTIYDSSQITKRRGERTVSGSFINRIQNLINPTTGYAPLLGISQQSIINVVNTGKMTQFRKSDGGCVFISDGCPCSPFIPESSSNNVVVAPGPVLNITYEYGSIKVSWDAPQIGTPPFNYTLTLTPSVFDTTPLTFTTTNTTFLVNEEDLVTNEQYLIEVKASNSAGSGQVAKLLDEESGEEFKVLGLYPKPTIATQESYESYFELNYSMPDISGGFIVDEVLIDSRTRLLETEWALDYNTQEKTITLYRQQTNPATITGFRFILRDASSNMTYPTEPITINTLGYAPLIEVDSRNEYNVILTYSYPDASMGGFDVTDAEFDMSMPNQSSLTGWIIQSANNQQLILSRANATNPATLSGDIRIILKNDTLKSPLSNLLSNIYTLGFMPNISLGNSTHTTQELIYNYPNASNGGFNVIDASSQSLPAGWSITSANNTKLILSFNGQGQPFINYPITFKLIGNNIESEFSNDVFGIKTAPILSLAEKTDTTQVLTFNYPDALNGGFDVTDAEVDPTTPLPPGWVIESPVTNTRLVLSRNFASNPATIPTGIKFKLKNETGELITPSSNSITGISTLGIKPSIQFGMRTQNSVELILNYPDASNGGFDIIGVENDDSTLLPLGWSIDTFNNEKIVLGWIGNGDSLINTGIKFKLFGSNVESPLSDEVFGISTGLFMMLGPRTAITQKLIYYYPDSQNGGFDVVSAIVDSSSAPLPDGWEILSANNEELILSRDGSSNPATISEGIKFKLVDISGNESLVSNEVTGISTLGFTPEIQLGPREENLQIIELTPEYPYSSNGGFTVTGAEVDPSSNQLPSGWEITHADNKFIILLRQNNANPSLITNPIQFRLTNNQQKSPLSNSVSGISTLGYDPVITLGNNSDTTQELLLDYRTAQNGGIDVSGAIVDASYAHLLEGWTISSATNTKIILSRDSSSNPATITEPIKLRLTDGITISPPSNDILGISTLGFTPNIILGDSSATAQVLLINYPLAGEGGMNVSGVVVDESYTHLLDGWDISANNTSIILSRDSSNNPAIITEPIKFRLTDGNIVSKESNEVTGISTLGFIPNIALGNRTETTQELDLDYPTANEGGMNVSGAIVDASYAQLLEGWNITATNTKIILSRDSSSNPITITEPIKFKLTDGNITSRESNDVSGISTLGYTPILTLGDNTATTQVVKLNYQTSEGLIPNYPTALNGGIDISNVTIDASYAELLEGWSISSFDNTQIVLSRATTSNPSTIIDPIKFRLTDGVREFLTNDVSGISTLGFAPTITKSGTTATTATLSITGTYPIASSGGINVTNAIADPNTPLPSNWSITSANNSTITLTWDGTGTSLISQNIKFILTDGSLNSPSSNDVSYIDILAPEIINIKRDFNNNAEKEELEFEIDYNLNQNLISARDIAIHRVLPNEIPNTTEPSTPAWYRLEGYPPTIFSVLAVTSPLGEPVNIDYGYWVTIRIIKSDNTVSGQAPWVYVGPRVQTPPT